MGYRKDWYKDYSYEVNSDGSYKIEIPNSVTDKIIVGDQNNELLDLVLCLFDELDTPFSPEVDPQKPS